MKDTPSRQQVGGSTIHFSDDLYVPVHEKWYCYDSTLKFATGKKIRVEGELNLDDVHLTAMSEDNFWDGIYFANAFGGSITNTRIDNISYSAITNNKSNIDITNTYIESAGSAVHVHSTNTVTDFPGDGPDEFPEDHGRDPTVDDILPVWVTSIVGSELHGSGIVVYALNNYTHVYISGSTIRHKGTESSIGTSDDATVHVSSGKIKGGGFFANSGIIDAAGGNHFCTGAGHLKATSNGLIQADSNYWHQAPIIVEKTGGTVQYTSSLGTANCTDVQGKNGAFTDASVYSSLSVGEGSMPRVTGNRSNFTHSALMASRQKMEQYRVARLQDIIRRDTLESQVAFLELGNKWWFDPLAVQFIESFVEQSGVLQVPALHLLARILMRSGETRQAFVVLARLEEISSSDIFAVQVQRFYGYFGEGMFEEGARLPGWMHPRSVEEGHERAAREHLLRMEVGEEILWDGFFSMQDDIEESQAAVDVEVSAYPNPFNPSTTIRYVLSVEGRVTVSIYDLLGRRVAVLLDAWQHKGVQEVVFDASSLPLYFYRLEQEHQRETGYLLLLE